MKDFNIGSCRISEDAPVFIIAELSANHEQDFELAEKTIKAMKDSGADAVKFQTYTPDSMTLDSDKPWFRARKDSLWAGQSLYDLYKKAYTPWEWHEKLQKMTLDLGMEFFSSPFDIKAVDQLETLNVPAYKIASMEILDIPLIKHAASKGKPMIVSTGVATEEDVRLAVDTIRETGNEQISLLKCTSAYPTPMEDVNLKQMVTLKEKFDVIVGLSDHTLGLEVPVASVALGAKIIEKHFILDRNSEGIDKKFSLMPEEFKSMVNAVRNIEKALGETELSLTDKMKSARTSARSLFAIKDIKAGEQLTSANVKSLRPNRGLHTRYYDEILTKKAVKDIEKGTPLGWDMLEM